MELAPKRRQPQHEPLHLDAAEPNRLCFGAGGRKRLGAPQPLEHGVECRERHLLPHPVRHEDGESARLSRSARRGGAGSQDAVL